VVLASFEGEKGYALPPGSMNLLSLNCRGCGQPETVQEVRSLVELHRPELVFLSETKLSQKRAQDLRWRLGFDHAFGVKS
jgi:hypothetical protein